jgi:hypothetical protein
LRIKTSAVEDWKLLGNRTAELRSFMNILAVRRIWPSSRIGLVYTEVYAKKQHETTGRAFPTLSAKTKTPCPDPEGTPAPRWVTQLCWSVESGMVELCGFPPFARKKAKDGAPSLICRSGSPMGD